MLHRTRDLLIRPTVSRGLIAIGVRNNQAGINRKPLAANQASCDASAHYALKHAPEDAAISEALIARM
jgi:hypothetical protein